MSLIELRILSPILPGLRTVAIAQAAFSNAFAFGYSVGSW